MPTGPRPSPSERRWSAEVSDRAVAATRGRDHRATTRRTRFSLVLSAAVPYQYFTLADPYRLIIDMPDVSFRLPKGSGQQGRGLIQAYRYGLFAPGKSRIVIDTKGPVRIERAAIADPARRDRGAARPRPGADRPGELPGQAAAARAARRRRRAGRDPDDLPRRAEGRTPSR